MLVWSLVVRKVGHISAERAVARAKLHSPLLFLQVKGACEAPRPIRPPSFSGLSGRALSSPLPLSLYHVGRTGVGPSPALRTRARTCSPLVSFLPPLLCNEGLGCTDKLLTSPLPRFANIEVSIKVKNRIPRAVVQSELAAPYPFSLSLSPSLPGMRAGQGSRANCPPEYINSGFGGPDRFDRTQGSEERMLARSMAK